jgi:SmpA / OmlA family
VCANEQTHDLHVPTMTALIERLESVAQNAVLRITISKELMKNHKAVCGLRTILFAVALSAATVAQAAGGFIVTAAQAASVKVGMNREEVRALLGRPAHNVKYRVEPGHTWTYGLTGMSSGNGETVFDVNFSAEGRVLSTSQRVEPTN